MFKDDNMNKLVLPLDLEVKLQENDIALSIHHLVQSILKEAFAHFIRHTGCPSYHPCMMLKLILCGYTQSTRINDHKFKKICGTCVTASGIFKNKMQKVKLHVAISLFCVA